MIGFFLGIFWGAILAILLWITCIFSGRLFHSSFRAKIPHHALCFFVAVLTCILFTIAFMLNKINGYVESVRAYAAEIIMSEDTFKDQMASVSDYTDLDEQINLDQYLEDIGSEYPFLKKYLRSTKMFESKAFQNNLSDILESETGAEKYTQVVQLITDTLAEYLQQKIKSVRNKMIWGIIIVQIMAFGIVAYSAYKKSKSWQNSYSQIDLSDYNNYD